GEDAGLGPDLRLETAMSDAPDARILALGVLADEQHVHVGRRPAGQRRRDPLEQPARPQVRPQIELLTNLEDDAPERDVIGDRGIADRAHEHGVEAPQRLDAVLRHHRAVLAVEGRAPGQLGPGDRESQGVDRLPGLCDHLRPHAVSRQQGDAVCRQAGAPTRPGTLSTYASASASGTTSAYFAWMSNRFASCGAFARSPTHSRGTSVGQPYWSRSIAVARTQPLVVAPQRITVSTPCETRIEARFVPKKPDAPFLRTTGSSSRRSRRGSISTQRPPSWRSRSAGAFWGQSPPSLPAGS